VAEINADRIKVTMNLRDTSGLYWAGTFSSLVDGKTDIYSQADVEILKSSLLGSMDKQKEFTYENDGITFKFGMANTERFVRLTKEKG
jgi:hypothetical protein